VAFTVPGMGPGRCRILVTDLTPGRWAARRAGAAETASLEVTAEGGAGWFEGMAGNWTLRPRP